jgi:hypothetical protein
MNTKALITTLAVLGSTSSLAMAKAAPAPVSASATVSWNASYTPVSGYATEYQGPIVRDHRSYQGPIVRDHRSYQPPVHVVVQPPLPRPVDRDWDGRGYGRQPRETILADGLTYNTGEYRKDIVLEGRGRFNEVALHEDGGRNFIKEVRIEFIGGAVQSIPVNQTLRPGQTMTFDLDGTNRAINRIFVYRADGNHMNIGFPSGGEFTVTAL